MKKPISLLVIANAHEAKIFEKVGHEKITLNFICNIEAELDSNHEKAGRTFNSTGSIRHGIEPHTDRRQVEKHEFAKKISKTLEELEKETYFDGLILMASHKMLEEIDNSLNHQLKEKITHKLAKDLTEYTTEEIKEYLETI